MPFWVALCYPRQTLRRYFHSARLSDYFSVSLRMKASVFEVWLQRKRVYTIGPKIGRQPSTTQGSKDTLLRKVARSLAILLTEQHSSKEIPLVNVLPEPIQSRLLVPSQPKRQLTIPPRAPSSPHQQTSASPLPSPVQYPAPTVNNHQQPTSQHSSPSTHSSPSY